MENHILIRYGELSLKKTNRRQFIQKITNNIKRALKEFTKLEYESRGMRFYIHLNDTPSGEIVEINEELINSPELINEDSFEAWLVKVKPYDFQYDSQSLLDYNDYIDELS